MEPTVEQRLAAIEARLAALEVEIRPRRPGEVRPEMISPDAVASVELGEPPDAGPAPATDSEHVLSPQPPIVGRPRSVELSASTVLGWGGAGALLLAAAYFIRLAIVEGWLTPWLQVGIAGAAGGTMIVGASVLRGHDARYTSLLGAAGVAVLYVAVYGAHVYHGLVGALTAVLAASAVSAISLGLHALFRQPLYVAFALAGTYLTPFLLPRGSIRDLAVYLTIWNLVYAAYAVWQRSRALYLAALYAFLIVFSWGWGRELSAILIEAAEGRPPSVGYGSALRQFAAAFLWTQTGVFLATAIFVSARARKSLQPAVAWAHFPALLFLYGMQYEILAREHFPMLDGPTDLPAWAGVAMALLAYAGWGVARVLVADPPRSSLQVVHAFAAVVVVHAVYIDLVPAEWRPLFALAVTAVIFGTTSTGARVWQWLVAGTLIFVAGYTELAWSWRAEASIAGERTIIGRDALSLAYPALLYALYFRAARSVDTVDGRKLWRWVLIVLAHSMALAGALWLVGEWLGSPDTTIERLWLSFAWAGIGLAWLLIATARGDRTLGRSTLGIFGAFALKVVFADLDHAGPLVRVGILVVLGITLYAGGWIYRRVVAPAAEPVTRIRS